MADDTFVISAVVSQFPYPAVAPDRSIRNGTVFAQPVACVTCRDRRCAEFEGLAGDPVTISQCYRSVGIAAVRIRDHKFVANGLNLREFRIKLPRRLKRDIERFVATRADLVRWAESAEAGIAAINKGVQRASDSALGMFHDVQTSVSTILRSSERLVAQQAGHTIEEKFAQLSPTEQAIVKGAELLNYRLRLMPLLANPASASYGQKRPRRVYRIVDFLYRALKPMADQRSVGLILTGRSFNEPPAYESLDTIPLVLIENAIKYSQPQQTVEITVEDIGHTGVEVSVSSFSPFISEDDRRHLYERGFRGARAEILAEKGSGLGLYLAKIVADAHGIRIEHVFDDRNLTIGGIRHCLNTFRFTVDRR